VRRCHRDVKRIGALFTTYRNVKLCVSGHLHETRPRGIPRHDVPEQPGGVRKLVEGIASRDLGRDVHGPDLHPDGTFNVEYVDYGWTVEPTPTTGQAVDT
jgi:hypothetical protein